MKYKTLARAVQNENLSTIEVLKAIYQADKESLHLSEGYNSIFGFLTKKFRYSDAAAVRRIRVARYLKTVPEMELALAKRKLDLTAASLIVGLKQPGLIKDVLKEAEGKSYREIEKLVSSKNLAPKSAKPDKIKPVAVLTIPKVEPTQKPTNQLRNQRWSCEEVKPAAPKPVVETKIEFQFTASQSLGDKISRAKEILSSKHPLGASLETVFEAALDEFIAKHENKTTREPRGSDNPRYISPRLKEEVMNRDDHCCSFISKNGTRCSSKWDLEVDHVRPFSLGGKTEKNNLRVLCRAHNLHEAKEQFGKGYVEKCY